MTQAEPRKLVPKDTQWFGVDVRGDAIVVPRDCIQYDAEAQPYVLIFVHDGLGSVADAVRGGRAYLHPARVELLREYEPGLLLVKCRNLRMGTPIFQPRPFP